MAILDTGSIIGSAWYVTSFFSRLNKLGSGSIPVKRFFYHGLSQVNYIRRITGEVEKFVNHLIGETCDVAVGHGAVFTNDMAMPAAVLWCEATEAAGIEPVIASAIVARSLDMCCVGCGSNLGGSEKSMLPLVFAKVILQDGEYVIYDGVRSRWIDVCGQISKKIGSSVVSGLFTRLEPPTGVLLAVQPDNTEAAIHQPLIENAPIVQENECVCYSFSTRESIDRFLKKVGAMTDTMLARIPAGGGLSGNLLRIEKGGRFTGAPKGGEK